MNTTLILQSIFVETKKIIGSITVSTLNGATPQIPPLSTIGNFAVQEEWRGRGIGNAIWARAQKVTAERQNLCGGMLNCSRIHLKK